MTRRHPFRRFGRILTPFGWRAVMLAAAAVGLTLVMGMLP